MTAKGSGPIEIVAADIGGTHARFAVATVERGRVVMLDAPATLETAAFVGLRSAWAAFGERLGRPLPRAAAIAVAAPVRGDAVGLTNSAWTIHPSLLPEQLNVDRSMVINDFGAVGHAVAQMADEHLHHLCGPDAPLPAEGVITICGPGTGLGVAQLFRHAGRRHVIETEGGHVDYAPLDDIEDAIVRRLRPLHARVSTERVCSGPGIVAIYETLAALAGRTVSAPDDRAIWAAALDGSDPLAMAALDRFCLALGAIAGDLALAHGAGGVVIAGGLGIRLRERLARSGFGERFVAKGRFQAMMAAIPVKLITHPQPGLFGAAAAFANAYADQPTAPHDHAGRHRRAV